MVFFIFLTNDIINLIERQHPLTLLPELKTNGTKKL